MVGKKVSELGAHSWTTLSVTCGGGMGEWRLGDTPRSAVPPRYLYPRPFSPQPIYIPSPRQLRVRQLTLTPPYPRIRSWPAYHLLTLALALTPLCLRRYFLLPPGPRSPSPSIVTHPDPPDPH